MDQAGLKPPPRQHQGQLENWITKFKSVTLPETDIAPETWKVTFPKGK